MTHLRLSLSLTLTLAAVGSAAAQDMSERYTFVITHARDTIASEVVQRTPTRVDADLVDKLSGIRHRIVLSLAPDGRIAHMTDAILRVGASDTVPLQGVDLEFRGDSAHVAVSGAESRALAIATTAGALAYVNPSGALLEQALLRAKALGGPSATIPLFQLAGGQTVDALITWLGRDSATIALAGIVIRAAVSPSGAMLGSVTLAQDVHVFRLAGAHPMAVARPDYGAPPGAPYSAEEVTVHTPEGLALTGTLTVPLARPAGRVAAVVTITGSGQQDRDERLMGIDGYRPFWQVADTLARRGIATLRLDDRGVNGSSAGPSSATSADFAGDIRAGLAYLRTRPEIDPARLGLVGHSEGGMIAPMIAVTDPSLRGIVLMAGPALTGREILTYQLHSERAADSLADAIPWVRYINSYDPRATARKVRVPVLVLQGETDRQVTPEQAEQLASAFRAGGNTDVTVRLFPATNHLFIADSDGNPARYGQLPSRNVRPEVLGAAADWLVAHLR